VVFKGALKEKKDKLNIVAAVHVRGEPHAVGPDEKRKTPEYLAAKTAKTTIGPKTEDENPETLIMDGQPQALGRRRGSGLPHTGRIPGTCKPLRDPPRPWPLGVPLGLQTRALLARGGCGASRVLLPAVRRGGAPLRGRPPRHDGDAVGNRHGRAEVPLFSAREPTHRARRDPAAPLRGSLGHTGALKPASDTVGRRQTSGIPSNRSSGKTPTRAR
jgi:hypothetical protein